MSEQTRKWTLMVYMAGDNGSVLSGMESAGYRDLAEMEAIGSTPEVAILVQFDTLSDVNHSYRICVQSATTARQMVKISEQNTGNPQSLVDFVKWGMANYPAQHYAVVLWNHGSGWKEDDIYRLAQQRNITIKADRAEVRSVANDSKRISSALFASSALAVMQIRDANSRAIAYDDSSKDFLDNAELQKALQQISSATGNRISLLGMDACLMSMVEVAYQVRHSVDYMVASQALEPMDGWPYTTILRELTAATGMTPETLAKLIVHRYGESYTVISRGGRDQITQSALALARIETLMKPIRAVAMLLRKANKERELYAEIALSRARRDVLRLYEDPVRKVSDYIDLCDFLTLLQSEYGGQNDLWDKKVTAILQHLETSSVNNPVIANSVVGTDELQRAKGLSIYFPDRGYSPFYDKLDFAISRWGKLIKDVNNPS